MKQTAGRHGAAPGSRLARRRKRRRWPGITASVVVGLIVLLVVGTAIAIGTGRWHLTPVLSGSMSPGLPTGSVAVTQRVPLQDIRVRDVIVIHRPDNAAKLLVHRVVSIKNVNGETVIETQGDGNAVKDPWQVALDGKYVHKVRFDVPLVGYVAVALHGERGRLILLAMGALIVVGVVTAFVKEARRERRGRADRRGADRRGAETRRVTVIDVTDLALEAEREARRGEGGHEREYASNSVGAP